MKFLKLLLILFTVLLLASCESKGSNEFLPESCKTYNEFIDLTSKEFYQALKSNRIEMTKRNYLDTIANTKKLTIDATGYDDFSLAGIECFQYLTSVEIIGESISDITPLKELTRVEEVKLDRTSVYSIEELAQMVKLTSLSVTNTKTFRNLDGIENLKRLVTVNLSGNSIQDISEIVNLTNVEMLTLDRNEIESIKILESLPKLAYLSANNNKITFDLDTVVLDENMDQTFKSLKKLELNQNLICKTEIFKTMQELTELELSFNNLNGSTCGNTEADFTFVLNSKIEKLIARDNQLTSIRTLNPTPDSVLNLKYLDLSSHYDEETESFLESKNKITSINPILQSQYSDHLTEIRFTGNEISEINNLSVLNNLELAYLDYNEITQIDNLFHYDREYLTNADHETSDGNLKSLQVLELSHNKIEAINDLVFNDQLIYLGLKNNLIQTINNSFRNMDSLTMIDLSGTNDISQITDSFDTLPLYALTIDDALSEEVIDQGTLAFMFNVSDLIIRDSFKNLPQFSKLNLSNRQILRIDETSFDLEGMNEVDVSGNALTSIEWVNNMPHLVKLNASNNQINLDSLSSLRLGELTVLNLNQNNIMKTDVLTSLKKIEELDLGNNQINDLTFLRNDAIKSSLKLLVLGNNKITDTSPIDGFTNLRGLYLEENNTLFEVQGISGLTKLQILKLPQTIETFNQAMNGLTSLIEFNDIPEPALKEILGALPAVTHFSNSFNIDDEKFSTLDFPYYKEISVNDSFKYVTDLSFNYTQITNQDLSFLNQLTRLESLSFENSQMTTINQIELPELTELNLKNSNIYLIENSFKALDNSFHLILNDGWVGQEFYINNSFTDLSELTLDYMIRSIMISNSFNRLKTLELVNLNMTDLSYLSQISTLEDLTIKDSIFDTLIFEEANFNNLKTLDLSSTLVNEITSSFNYSTGQQSNLTALTLGKVNTINNSFNNIKNLKLTNNTISAQAIDQSFNNVPNLASSKLTIENSYELIISQSFNDTVNQTENYKTVEFKNGAGIFIIDGFNDLIIDQISFNNKATVYGLYGFKNVGLSNYELVGFNQLQFFGGFDDITFKTIEFAKSINELQIQEIDTSQLTKLNVLTTQSDLIDHIITNIEPQNLQQVEFTSINSTQMTTFFNKTLTNLTEIKITNSITSFDWLTPKLLNQLNTLNVNTYELEQYAETLVYRSISKVLTVYHMEEKFLIDAVKSRLKEDSSFNQLESNRYEADYLKIARSYIENEYKNEPNDVIEERYNEYIVSAPYQDGFNTYIAEQFVKAHYSIK